MAYPPEMIKALYGVSYPFYAEVKQTLASTNNKRSRHQRHTTTGSKMDRHRVNKQTRDIQSSRQPPRPSQDQCQRIMKDTLERSLTICTQTLCASLDSFFYHTEQIDHVSIETSPNHTLKPFRFVADDTFTVARKLIDMNRAYRRSTAVLSMASDELIGGSKGLPTGSSQEGELCMSSTLYTTLRDHRASYPWKENIPSECGNVACIYSPDVVIFKDSAANQYRELPTHQHKVVSVISLAAPRASQRIPFLDRQRYEIREKIRMLYRVAVLDRKSVLVLGAFGCAEYHCPPREVAQIMKSVLLDEQEFRGWFEEVAFAISDKKTCGIFREVFEQGTK